MGSSPTRGFHFCDPSTRGSQTFSSYLLPEYPLQGPGYLGNRHSTRERNVEAGQLATEKRIILDDREDASVGSVSVGAASFGVRVHSDGMRASWSPPIVVK